MFKKNSFFLGGIIGAIIPLLLGLIIFISFPIIKGVIHFQYHKLILLSFIPNVFLIRYYFKIAVLEKTGKAFLFSTFLLVLLYFIFESELKTIIY